MADVVKLCTSDTLVKNLLDKFFFIFIYVEVQIEQIKMTKSFIGLAGLIFEINGKKPTISYFFRNQNHTKIGSCCVLDAYACAIQFSYTRNTTHNWREGGRSEKKLCYLQGI